MSKTDPDGPDPTLASRLRAELDRVHPPAGEPRYLRSRGPIRAWRLAPVALAIACTGILALTAFAATGSPNPAVWTNRVETVINPPTLSPSPEDTESGTQSPAPAAAPTHKPTAEPTERAEPTSSPEHESPEPSGDHQTPSASPSPPGDH